MERLRLADVRTPLARVLNECTTSPRVVDIANESHRRLVNKGSWVGTVRRYRICISSSGCLVWPRQIETILGYWVCNSPGTIRTRWYEESPSGPGLINECGCGPMVDRDPVATFDEPDNAVSKVQVVSDVPEAVGSRILLRGYDHNAQWIRTEDPVGSGLWIDGEYIAISNNASYSTSLFTKITPDVVKPITKGAVRLWQYDTTLGTVTKALAYYEPDETLPIYRASLLPGLGASHGCGSSTTTDSDSSCTNTQVTVQAKLRHMDVHVDNDFFLLGNLAAIKLMAMAILKEERNLFDEAVAYEAKAIRELQAELNSYEGDGAVPIIRQESRATWGAGVQNPITLGYL